MAMRKVKIGDEVQVLTGKEKGKRGIVQKIDGERVTVSGLNIKVFHKSGGIVTAEGSMHCSNVLPYSSKLKKACRVGFKFNDGKKIRFLKQSGEELKERTFKK